ncbi:MAG: hypothetical protein V1854_00295 [Methanobacteriota archaeon]
MVEIKDKHKQVLQWAVQAYYEDYLEIGQDYPCIISFDLGEAGRCEYMQAPRIESE